jgi:hypothetical protein
MTLRSVSQKKTLAVKGPAVHVGVEILKVGVFGDGFVIGSPVQTLAKQVDQSGFPGTDVAGQNQIALHLLKPKRQAQPVQG